MYCLCTVYVLCWCTSGVLLVYCWCTVGVLMVYILLMYCWCQLPVCCWCTAVALLLHCRCTIYNLNAVFALLAYTLLAAIAVGGRRVSLFWWRRALIAPPIGALFDRPDIMGYDISRLPWTGAPNSPSHAPPHSPTRCPKRRNSGASGQTRQRSHMRAGQLG